MHFAVDGKTIHDGYFIHSKVLVWQALHFRKWEQFKNEKIICMVTYLYAYDIMSNFMFIRGKNNG